MLILSTYYPPTRSLRSFPPKWHRRIIYYKNLTPKPEDKKLMLEPSSCLEIDSYQPDISHGSYGINKRITGKPS